MSSSAEVEGASGGAGPSDDQRDRDQTGEGEHVGNSRASEQSSEGSRRAEDGTADAAGAVHAAATDGEGEGAGSGGREGGGEGAGGGGGAGKAGGGGRGGDEHGKQKISLSAKMDALRKMVEQRRHDFNKAKAEKMKEEEKRYKAWLQESKAKRNSIASPIASVGPSSPAVAESSSSSFSSPGEKLSVKVASPDGQKGGGGGERGEGSGGTRYLTSGSTTPNIASPVSTILSKDSYMGSPPPNSPASSLAPFPKSVSSPAGSSSDLHAAAAAAGIPSPEDKSRRPSSAEESGSAGESGSGSPVPREKARTVRRRSVLMIHADSMRQKLDQQMEEMEAGYQKKMEERRKMAAWKEAKGGTWQVDTLLADSDSSYQGYLQAVVEAAALKCELIKDDI